jgi:hypothetical protein
MTDLDHHRLQESLSRQSTHSLVLVLHSYVNKGASYHSCGLCLRGSNTNQKLRTSRTRDIGKARQRSAGNNITFEIETLG